MSLLFLVIPLLAILGLLLLFLITSFLFLAIDLFLPFPFVPTKDAKRAIELAKVKKGEVVYDLGSGDGRVLIFAAKKKALAIGYEINPFLVFLSKIIAKLKGVDKNVKVILGDFWKADLGDADVVFIYGRKKFMGRLEKLIFPQIKKGTRVVANKYPFQDRKHKEKFGDFYLYLK